MVGIEARSGETGTNPKGVGTALGGACRGLLVIAMAVGLLACGSQNPVATKPTTCPVPPPGETGDELSYLWGEVLPGGAWIEITKLGDDTPPDYAQRPGGDDGRQLVTAEFTLVHTAEPDITTDTFARGFLMRPRIEAHVRDALDRQATVLLNIVSEGKDTMYAGRFPTALMPDGTVELGEDCGYRSPDVTSRAKQAGTSEVEFVRHLTAAGVSPWPTPTTSTPWANTDPDRRQVVPGAQVPNEVWETLEFVRLVVSYPPEWGQSNVDTAPQLCAKSAVAWSDCVVLIPGSANPDTINAYRQPDAAIELIILRGGGGWDAPRTPVMSIPATDVPKGGWFTITLTGTPDAPVVAAR